MSSEYNTVATFLIVGVAFVILVFWVAWLLRPYRPTRQKLANYECGERPVGQAWVQFRIIFYLFALIFVVFDVEVVFVLPWAYILKELVGRGFGPFAFWEMMAFLGILLVGWLYAWRKGALQWE